MTGIFRAPVSGGGIFVFGARSAPTRRTSTNTASDTTEQVLDSFVIPAGYVTPYSSLQTRLLGKTNTGLVAANFILRMNGVLVLATTGHSANAINSMVHMMANIGVLNAQVALPTSNLNQIAGQGAVSGTLPSYSIDFSGDVTVTLSTTFAGTATGMWAERQIFNVMVMV